MPSKILITGLIAEEYCPPGWKVKRVGEDYSAQTCNPMSHATKKCPKPYTCVIAPCDISFCCVSPGTNAFITTSFLLANQLVDVLSQIRYLWYS